MCLVGNFFTSQICGDPYIFLRNNLKNKINANIIAFIGLCGYET
jgi:hypothetical protein